MASQITSLTIAYSTVYSDADQRKNQSSESLAFVWGIHQSPVNSPHKGLVTRKMFPFDDVIIGAVMRKYLPWTSIIMQKCNALDRLPVTRRWLCDLSKNEAVLRQLLTAFRNRKTPVALEMTGMLVTQCLDQSVGVVYI